ncbi:TlpA family protein disulfide reductase [Alicycliphilus denitrificans]|uniref:TlpA family protein disulfide reductase n=1 Tax=Alicycliphilus denitrificans TaxID=179636 RepID=UPI00217DE681|nr:thioredoxin family protein [Alicycliphilus denitrificans]
MGQPGGTARNRGALCRPAGPARRRCAAGHAQLGRALGYKALPTTLFYDGRGRLVAVRAGELSAATLAHHLAQITGPARPAP